jgi:hypothetical protein
MALEPFFWNNTIKIPDIVKATISQGLITHSTMNTVIDLNAPDVIMAKIRGIC